MFIWLLISFLCFYTLWKFTRTIEIEEHGEWKPFTAPLWLWIIAAIICIVPIINVIGVIVVVALFIAESRYSIYPEVRFKNRNFIDRIITKILNTLNKEY